MHSGVHSSGKRVVVNATIDKYVHLLLKPGIMILLRYHEKTKLTLKLA